MVFAVGEHGEGVLDGVVDDVLDLQLVLVVGMRVRQFPELLRQVEAVRHILRRDKVLCHFDAVVQISYLITNTESYEENSGKSI